MDILVNKKLYLDTSVISYLKQEDVPDKMKVTNEFWEKIKNSQNYDICLSSVVIREINDCHEPKRTFMLNKLKEINFKFLEISDVNYKISNQIISLGILPKKCRDDCLHISAAVIEGCDYIVSWNFKHLVNVETINGVRGISIFSGFKSIDILSPEMFVGGTKYE